MARNGKLHFSVIVIVAVIIHLVDARGRIQLDSSRGYVDIVVAINNDIKESDFPDLLQSIQTEFSSASGHLYTATRQTTYFKEIRILVPPSWADSPNYQEATWETFDDADVLINSSSYGPYVWAPNRCGDAGHYMALTPEFISDSTGTSVGYGAPQKTIVHEWGHLRWGLKDEYAYDNDKYDRHFYYNYITQKSEATRCVEGIPGTIRQRKSGVPCTKDSNGVYKDEECRFADLRSQNDFTASFMYKQFLPSTSEFCDSSSDAGIKHNVYALNRQNRLCHFQSAWEVMRAHPDFFQTPAPRSSIVTQVPTEFVIVKEPNTTTVVLVLDTSGSMSGDKLTELQIASRGFIEDVPVGSRLGMVEFNSGASTLSSIRSVDTDSDREQLIAAIPTYASGSTSIGAGVRHAVQLLTSDSISSLQKIILVTDGQENASPYITDVIDEVIAANVVVCTVAIGSSADPSLELFSSSTGGKQFTHEVGSSSLYLSFFQLANEIHTSGSSVANKPTILETSDDDLAPGEELTRTFFLDATLDGSLKVVLAYFQNNAFYGEARLTDPNGVVFNQTSGFYTDDANQKQAAFNIDSAFVSVGSWVLFVKNTYTSSQRLEIIIQPSSRAGTTPITTTTLWAFPTVAPPQRQILYVTVSRGESPLINAELVAMVRITGGTSDIILLPRDDGADPDIDENDGVYSAYFTQFSTMGRYGVQVTVKGTSNTQAVEGVIPGRGGPREILDEDADYPLQEPTYVPFGAFQREVVGESFSCENSSCTDANLLDLYPPSAITDLTASDIQSADSTINITFTAPGDDLSTGNASYYNFHYSLNFTELVYGELGNSTLIPQDWFVAGDTTNPQTAGSIENFLIQINTGESVTSFSIRVVAVDDEGNEGDPSNIATSMMSDSEDPLPTLPTLSSAPCVKASTWLTLTFIAICTGIVSACN